MAHIARPNHRNSHLRQLLTASRLASRRARRQYEPKTGTNANWTDHDELKTPVKVKSGMRSVRPRHRGDPVRDRLKLGVAVHRVNRHILDKNHVLGRPLLCFSRHMRGRRRRRELEDLAARCMNYWDGTTGDAFHCFDDTADGG